MRKRILIWYLASRFSLAVFTFKQIGRFNSDFGIRVANKIMPYIPHDYLSEVVDKVYG